MTQVGSSQPASRKNQLRTSLTQNLDDKLASYALAAGAAGVAVMALAQPSPAEIIYTQTRRGMPVEIQFIHNGKTDFSFGGFGGVCSFGESCVSQQLIVYANGQNHVLATYGQGIFAQAVESGFKIGWPAHFGNAGYAFMDRCKATRVSYYVSGSWLRAKNLYLGLEFVVEGKVHFGWARLNVRIKGNSCTAYAVLTGYAYETEPGKPILAGATSDIETDSKVVQPRTGLGALALGSAGLDAWRREEEDH